MGELFIDQLGNFFTSKEQCTKVLIMIHPNKMDLSTEEKQASYGSNQNLNIHKWNS